MLNKKLTGQQAAEKTYIEDVFSTYLYTGTGSSQTINNGIDLAGKGGLVWLKKRNAALNNFLYDSNRGVTNSIYTDSSYFQETFANTLTNFNSNGFSLGSSTYVNNSSDTFASWTFRKAPKFFDVVTWTGNNAGSRTISHSLGQVPGMIIIKATGISENWVVHHRSTGFSQFLYLNDTSGALTANRVTASTASDFTIAYNTETNSSTSSYVAYLFAHDTTTDGLIQCGSFTTDGSGNATVNLGWEPQYILFKRSDAVSQWFVMDTMRGLNVSTTTYLIPNLVNSETTFSGSGLFPTATGFQTTNSLTSANATYIYTAIRRPMKVPTDGTKVFMPQATRTATNGTASQNAYTSNFPVDLFFQGARVGSTSNATFYDRLRGSSLSLVTSSTDVEGSGGVFRVDDMDGVYTTSSLSATSSFCGWMFQRALGFFDVVCYTGNGASSKIITHGLKEAPEIIITKVRSTTGNWFVYHAGISGAADRPIYLNSTEAVPSFRAGYGGVTPSSTQYYVEDVLNTSAATYVSYLFASCPGVSKVGTYTGNGSTQTINCGFSAGARFVLIKRTDSTGDWYVWDTARGIVAGNDPHLSLNTTVAEVTTDDTIDPASTGFIVNQLAATNVNVNAATYIYLAIA